MHPTANSGLLIVSLCVSELNARRVMPGVGCFLIQMKQCDLETIYSDLASRLPIQTDGDESITLSSENLPLPPSKMTTDNLYILKGEHFYNDWFRVDMLGFYAYKETYQRLGLLILSAIFHRVPKIEVRLNHPHSQINSLSVQPHHNIKEWLTGYHTQPLAFEYHPKTAYLHPFNCFNCQINPRDLPCFELSNSKKLNFTDEDWKERDTVKIFGSDAGLVIFAELLLNASLTEGEETEFALESESGGYRAVGISSAEAILYLPGHLAWTEEHWEESA